MKDYYYFLGIDKNATEEDIRRAYRKLSLKYHPDKNEKDGFFESRFRETQEAYDCLSDEKKKRQYDQILSQYKQQYRTLIPPSIESFTTNTTKAQKGDVVILKWAVSNADVVKIVPIGLVDTHGEKNILIEDFIEGKKQFILHAQNTLIRKTVVKAVTITETETTMEEDQASHKNFPKEQIQAKTHPSKKQIWLFYILALLFTVLVMLYIIWKR